MHIDKKIPVGISSCLLGDRVRFDGGHKKHSYIVNTLGDYFEFRPFCPEMAIGMGVPRETIRLVESDNGIRVRGTKTATLDVTRKLEACASEQLTWQKSLCGYIVKKDSPSCGMERVKVYKGDFPEKKGSGMYTATMMKNLPYLPVEEEGRLGDAGLRENFIQRVCIMYRWRAMIDAGISWGSLMSFHAQHKLIYFSHNQNLTRDLGRQLAEASQQPSDENLQRFSDIYLHKMMELLKNVATPANHVNTLEHIRGYLKKVLDADDKKELTETIEQYRQGYLPLVVPVTLLKHHFRKSPDPYIDQSWYLNPYPPELMLRNAL